MYYENIENFYRAYKEPLINGEYRPVVSYNKDAEEYINKLVQIYKDNNKPDTISVSQIEEGLKVSKKSNVATTESPLTWISLGLLEEIDNKNKSKKDPDYVYKISEDFKLMVDQDVKPGVHILNKLYSIKDFSSITKFLNLLICTLREGYLEDYIIDFPRDNRQYLEIVPDKNIRIKYSQRINRIYGYNATENDSPHASMRAINNLANLELIKQSGKTPEGFTKYKLTDYGHQLLLHINSIIEKKMNLYNDRNLLNNFIYQNAIRTKPFLLLAGISGSGKSRIVRKLAQATDNIDVFANDNERWNCHRPKNFEIIQVKPNWHNSMDMVGYLSNIPTPHYVFTPFVNFILKAWCFPAIPFFLCLDEMNLAPVEEYFAEFLSAIESRSKSENGEYHTDPIIPPFKEFGDEVCKQLVEQIKKIQIDLSDEIIESIKNKGLTLPENLIVVGTVNMDETTYTFSRKVLDRAMSIEMNEVDYNGFLKGETESNIPLLIQQNALLVHRPISAHEVKEKIEANKIIEYLKEINEILEDTPFKLGYRAANEAMLYVSAAIDFGQYDMASALDDFTLMKVLSRLEGDENKMKIDADDKKIKGKNWLNNAQNEAGGLTLLSCIKQIIKKHLGSYSIKKDTIHHINDELEIDKTTIDSEEIETLKDDNSSVDNAVEKTDQNLTSESNVLEELKSIKKLDSMIRQLNRDHFVSYWT